MFKYRKALSITVLALAALCFTGSVAFAQTGDAAAAAVDAPGSDNAYTMYKFIALASGLCLGVAAFGGAIAQGRAATAALEGIARNPGASGKIFTPMILGLALIESLVIYALLISYLLLAKVPGLG